LFVSVIFICYLFLFIFRADPPEPQQGRAGRHNTADLTPPRPPDLTAPVGRG